MGRHKSHLPAISLISNRAEPIGMKPSRVGKVMAAVGLIALAAVTPLTFAGPQATESEHQVGLYAGLALLNLMLAGVAARVFARTEESRALRSKVVELESQIAEEHRMRLHVSEFAAGSLLRRVASDISAQASGRWIQTHIPTTPLMAHGDPVAFRTIAQSLVADAISATPEHSIIEVRAHDAQDEIVVSVDDQGAERKEPEFAKRLAEAEGLRLWIEVAPGRGRTVSFTVPKSAAPKSRLGHLQIVQESPERI